MTSSLKLEDVERMASKAAEASLFLKAVGQETRLLILCHLATGERSVTELEQLLGTRQAAVSQQLARLRQQRIVRNRRDGKVVFYSIADPRAAELVGTIHRLFCAPDAQD